MAAPTLKQHGFTSASGTTSVTTSTDGGSAAVGDLCVVVAASGSADNGLTASLAATAMTNDSAGGANGDSDGTRCVYTFSAILASGDIDGSGHVTVTLTGWSSGTRRFDVYVFNHANGWSSTTATRKVGNALSTSTGTTHTLTSSAATVVPAVAVIGWACVNAGTVQFNWDGNGAGNSDNPGGSSLVVHISARPGSVNTTGYSTAATPSCVLTAEPSGGSRSTALYVYQTLIPDSTITLTGISSTLAVTGPTLAAGAVTITLTGISSTLSMTGPALAGGGSQSISITGISSTLAVTDPALTATASIDLTGLGIVSTLTVGAPSTVLIPPNKNRMSSASTMFAVSATVIYHSVTKTSTASRTKATANVRRFVTLTGISSTLTVSTPTIQRGPTLTGIASTLAATNPTLVTTVTITLAGISSTLNVTDPTLVGQAPGTQNIVLLAIPSSLVATIPTVSPGPISIVLTGIASTLHVGHPSFGGVPDDTWTARLEQRQWEADIVNDGWSARIERLPLVAALEGA